MAASVDVKPLKFTTKQKLIDDPLIVCLRAMMAAAHKGVTMRSPVDTGNLRSSMQPGGKVTKLDVQGRKATVGTNVVYALPLQDPQTRDPMYRAGPFVGTPTRGWFTSGIQDEWAAIEDAARELGSNVRKAWESA